MENENEFIERILESRRASRELRLAAQARAAEAMGSMREDLGEMLSFKAMSTDAFPVATEIVSSIDDGSELPEFGALVTAHVSDEGCWKVEVQARVEDADEFMTLTLHPAKGGEYVWLLEASSRGFDGSEKNASKEYKSALKALQVVRARLLDKAIHYVSGGELAGLPVLPSGDDYAARTVASQIGKAQEEAKTLAERKAMLARETARASFAISNVWDQELASMTVLEKLGYGVGVGPNGRGIESERTQHGVRVRLTAVETWAEITIEALQDDPRNAVFRVRDCYGRNEIKEHLRVDDAARLASAMRRVVLEEIEIAETAFLPNHAVEPARAPAM